MSLEVAIALIVVLDLSLLGLLALVMSRPKQLRPHAHPWKPTTGHHRPKLNPVRRRSSRRPERTRVSA